MTYSAENEPYEDSLLSKIAECSVPGCHTILLSHVHKENQDNLKKFFTCAFPSQVQYLRVYYDNADKMDYEFWPELISCIQYVTENVELKGFTMTSSMLNDLVKSCSHLNKFTINECILLIDDLLDFTIEKEYRLWELLFVKCGAADNGDWKNNLSTLGNKLIEIIALRKF